jgi:hypothetical protein
MTGRKALLKKLASVTDWDTARRAALEGESWLQTRNTLYRFRDGVCFAVATRDPAKQARASSVLGLRLVGWLVGNEGRGRFTYAWEVGAAAVLWKGGGGNGSDETMALTSPTTTFTRGKSPSHLQALHDAAPPDDSQTYQRRAASPSLTGTE